MEKILNEILTEIKSLKQGQDNLKTDFTDLKQGQELLKTDINNLKQGQELLKADVNSLKQGQELLKADFMVLKQEQEKTNEKLAHVEEKLVHVEVDIKDLKQMTKVIFEQTADLTEFKTETRNMLDQLIENQKSLNEMYGAHEMEIRNLKRRPV